MKAKVKEREDEIEVLHNQEDDSVAQTDALGLKTSFSNNTESQIQVLESTNELLKQELAAATVCSFANYTDHQAAQDSQTGKIRELQTEFNQLQDEKNHQVQHYSTDPLGPGHFILGTKAPRCNDPTWQHGI